MFCKPLSFGGKLEKKGDFFETGDLLKFTLTIDIDGFNEVAKPSHSALTSDFRLLTLKKNGVRETPTPVSQWLIKLL